ncbi:MAG: hypothetical protein ABI640_04535 [Gammaproteobacteria bacterium]
MKYLFIALLGLLIGAGLASSAIYYNPFSVHTGAAPTAGDRVLKYSLPDQVLTAAVGEDALLAGRSSGVEGLWEETIDRAAVIGLVLTDETGQPAAIASRLMAASPSTDLLLTGVVLNDYWLITLPGQGTLFVRSDSNVWPFLKETLLPVWLFDRPWHGPLEYRPTVGPNAGNTGSVLGVAGVFEGKSGSAVEHYDVTAFGATQNSTAAVGELFLHFSEQQVAQQ